MVSKGQVAKGDVVGTLDNLKLNPGSVTADKLAPELANEMVNKSTLAAQLAKMSGEMVGKGQVAKGDVVGTLDNLTLKPGSVTADKLAPELAEEMIGKSALAAQVAKMSGEMVGKGQIAKGDVVGTLDNLKLKPGSVTAESLAPELANELVGANAMAAQLAKMSGQMMPKNQVANGDVAGTLDNLKLKPGSVTADKLAPNLMEDAIGRSPLAQQMAKLNAQAISRQQIFQGDVVGTAEQLQLKPGAVTSEKLSPELQAELVQLRDSVRPQDMKFGGDIIGTATNIQLAAGAVKSENLAPKLIENAIGKSALAGEVAQLKREAMPRTQIAGGDVVGGLQNLKISDGAVTPEKLSPEIRAGLREMEEGMLRKDGAFAGDIQGVSSNMKIRNGAVTAEKLAPDVIEKALSQSLVAGQMAKLQRQVITRSFIAGGDVIGPLDALQIRPGSITKEKLAPELVQTLQELEKQKQDVSKLAFDGDVAGRANSLKLRPGVVGSGNLDPALLSQLMQAAGQPLQVDAAFKGDVVGTADNLSIRPGAVGAEELAPGVMNEYVKQADLAANMAKVSGSTLSQSTIFQGDVVGTANDLRLKKGVVEEAFARSDAGKQLMSRVDSLKQASGQTEQILGVIEGVKQDAMSVNTRFKGDVEGTPKELRIQRNAVRAEHIAAGSVTRDKLNLAGGLEPGRQNEDSLGSDKNRWKSLFLNDRLDYEKALTFTSGGVVQMVLDEKGNLSVEGLRLSASDESPSIIGGHSANRIDQGALGATIAGGGNKDQPNVVSSQYGSIAGGFGNQVTGFNSSIGGGQDHIAGGKPQLLQADI